MREDDVEREPVASDTRRSRANSNNRISRPGSELSNGEEPSRGVVHHLARFFKGLHWAVGMTTLPDAATPGEERSFVLMWLGIIVLIVGFLGVMIYLLML